MVEQRNALFQTLITHKTTNMDYTDYKTRRDRLPQEETAWYIYPLFFLISLIISGVIMIEAYGANEVIELVSNLFV